VKAAQILGVESQPKGALTSSSSDNGSGSDELPHPDEAASSPEHISHHSKVFFSFAETSNLQVVAFDSFVCQDRKSQKRKPSSNSQKSVGDNQGSTSSRTSPDASGASTPIGKEGLLGDHSPRSDSPSALRLSKSDDTSEANSTSPKMQDLMSFEIVRCLPLLLSST